jgi:hypothetical protein
MGTCFFAATILTAGGVAAVSGVVAEGKMSKFKIACEVGENPLTLFRHTSE